MPSKPLPNGLDIHEYPDPWIILPFLCTGEVANTSDTEAREIIDVLSTLSSEDEDDNREIHGTVSLGLDRDEVATKSKRRLDQFTSYVRQACRSPVNRCSSFDQRSVHFEFFVSERWLLPPQPLLSVL